MFSRNLDACGYMIIERFVTPTQCRKFLTQINDFRTAHSVPVIDRPNRDLPLRYAVIDGNRINEYLPDIVNLYRRVTGFIRTITSQPLEPLADSQVACNINITRPGGSYRYHYDRNALTAILYLNQTDGGETECYPNYRLRLPRWLSSGNGQDACHTALQRVLDRVLQYPLIRSIAAQRLLIKPCVGRLLIMQGNRCLHCVRRVLGGKERINIIMSYDHPCSRHRAAQSSVAQNLNSYLYSEADTLPSDPNYLGW